MDQDSVKLIDGVSFRKLLKSAGEPEVRRQRLAVAKSLANAVDTKAIDRENLIIPFTISTASVDREGDTIAVEGWKLDHYRRNPVVLFGHDHYQPPVAKSLTEFSESGRLKSRAQFTPRDLYEFGYMVFRLYADGFMNATSVGFIPEKWEYAEEGKGDKGLNFSEQEMIEYSCVPVPANPEALIEARAKGIDTRPYREWTSRLLDERRAKHVVGSQSVVERLHALSDPTGRRIFTSLQEVKLPAEDPIDVKALMAARKDGDPDVAALPDDESVLELERVEDDATAVQPPAAGEEAPAAPAQDKEETPAGDPPPSDKALTTAEATDTIRWNRSLSKAFDIDRQQFQPGNAVLRLASDYIGCEVKQLVSYNDGAYGTRMGAYLTALDEFVAEGRVDDIRNLDRTDKEWPPRHDVIQLNSSRRSTFLVDGIRFMEWRGVKFVLRVEPEWAGIDVCIYAQRGDGATRALELLDAVSKQADTYKFLKGEAFTLSGEFLERGTTQLSDVFLEPRNEKAILRAIELLNNKAGEMEPRGMMLLGPPGTGKTLSGRVLRDQAKATFIHVAARDLARRGAFGGMLEAIKIARQNNPAVVFIEDVDNFMDSWTVDMLKTEMDGLTQHKGILIVLTTNYPELMPKALIDRPGRFHDVCSFGLPDEKVRLRMVQRWMPELTPEQQLKAVRETHGYSGAHLRELARFAEILREQDEVDLGVALDLALAKMKEQREIITASQTAGSRYRAPVSVEERTGAPARGGVVRKSFGDGALVALHGNDNVIPLAQYEALAKGITVDRLGDVMAVHINGEVFTKVGKLLQVNKAGRVLSAKNERSLTEGLDAIYAAADKLKGVLAQVQQEGDAGTEAAPDDGKGKDVGDEVIEAEHVILLEEEHELGDVDEGAVRAAIHEAAAETLMQLTGRVW